MRGSNETTGVMILDLGYFYLIVVRSMFYFPALLNTLLNRHLKLMVALYLYNIFSLLGNGFSPAKESL